MTTLSGKTALVTGASRGIGRASALALAKAGAQVLVHYGSGAKEAEAVVAQIRKAGGRADAVAADLAAPEGPHKLAKRAREIIGDRLDILIANAGVSKAATIEDTTIADFDRLFAINVRAPFFLVQQLLPILHEGSCIVLLSSLGARAAVGALSAYSATKGAIDTLVKHFAYVLGGRGIRVNAVAPGVVQTDMSNFTKTDAGREYALGMQALKRLAEPDDIGGVVAFLASDDARWITGDTIHVDGGRSSESKNGGAGWPPASREKAREAIAAASSAQATVIPGRGGTRPRRHPRPRAGACRGQIAILPPYLRRGLCHLALGRFISLNALRGIFCPEKSVM
jgi:NAD(P)-dependent dehydrogenase (short-subunit alcohol dehydrogenase family)